ncbi:MAG: hypothetical protein WDM92_01245 [Caulobacteraceae bacterium]
MSAAAPKNAPISEFMGYRHSALRAPAGNDDENVILLGFNALSGMAGFHGRGGLTESTPAAISQEA